jgi:hypothetical protein
MCTLLVWTTALTGRSRRKEEKIIFNFILRLKKQSFWLANYFKAKNIFEPISIFDSCDYFYRGNH